LEFYYFSKSTSWGICIGVSIHQQELIFDFEFGANKRTYERFCPMTTDFTWSPFVVLKITY